MRFIVRIPELDSTLYEAVGQETHQELLRIVRKLRESGKLIEGGLFADERGGFLLMEADSCSEQEALLDSLFDRKRYTVENRQILPFGELEALAERIEGHSKKKVKAKSFSLKVRKGTASAFA